MAGEGKGAEGALLQRLTTSFLRAVWFCLVLAGFLPVGHNLAPAQGPTAGKPVILEFSRLACPVCAKVEAALKEIEARYGQQIEVRILHIDKEEHLFKQYGISIVPTQVFLDAAGKEVARNEGVISQEQLIRKLKELGLIRD